MLLVDFINQGVKALQNHYVAEEAKSIIMILCQEVLCTTNYTHIVEPNYFITPDKLTLLQEGLSKLCKGQPIQYVIGTTEFYGKTFNVNANVLIPRQETEILCKHAITLATSMYKMRISYGKQAEPIKILDLCTGAGCIAWILALYVPTAKVIGIDISTKALHTAQTQNFEAEIKATGATPPTFIQADVLNYNQNFNYGKFDLIVSNPPYIMDSEKPMMHKNVLHYEPSLALFVPDNDPLKFYKAIVQWSHKYLSQEGYGIIEINNLLYSQTEQIIKNEGYSKTEIIKDFYNKERFITYKK